MLIIVAPAKVVITKPKVTDIMVPHPGRDTKENRPPVMVINLPPRKVVGWAIWLTDVAASITAVPVLMVEPSVREHGHISEVI